MNPLWSILVPALAGLIAGVIGSLVAPWVNWGIEKRREKHKYRQAIVQRCRELVNSPTFTKQILRASPEYKHLRPYLAQHEADSIERDNHILGGEIQDGPWDAHRRLVTQALEKLEKAWDLV